MSFNQHKACLLACCLATILVGSGCAWLPNARLAQKSADQIASLDGDLSVARLAERRGNLKRAKDLYHAVLEYNPGQALAHHRLAVIAAEEGQLDKSLDHFRLAQENMMAPSAELMGDLGYVEYLLGNFDAAQVALEQSLEIDPQNERTLNNLGLVAGMKGSRNESLAYFQQAVGQAEAHANLAYVLTQQGEMDQAVEHYHRALESDGELRMAAHALVQIKNQTPARPMRMPEREMRLATSGQSDWRNTYQQVDAKLNRELVAKYQSSAPTAEASVASVNRPELTPAQVEPDLSRLRDIQIANVPTADPGAMPAVARPLVQSRPQQVAATLPVAVLQAAKAGSVDTPSASSPASGSVIKQVAHQQRVSHSQAAPQAPKRFEPPKNELRLGNTFDQPLDFQF